MKILVLTNLYPPHAVGGYEERCRRVVDGLRALGHDARVLASDHQVPGVAEKNPPADPPHVARVFRIHGFFGHPWLPPHQLHRLEKHNHAALRAALSAHSPDVVHVWNLGGLSKSLMLTLQDWGGPVVYDVSDHWIARSLRADVWLRWWNGEAGGAGARLLRGLLLATGLARLVRRAAPFAPWSELRFDRVYFCSAALRALTVAKGWPVAHAAVIYCGVETGLYATRPPSERFEKLLYVGRLDPDKDPLTAIRALALLHAQGRRHLTLTLYGRGPEDYVAALKAEIAALGLGPAVAFASAPSTEMVNIYARHDALVFTSAWEEPFALTPLEGMSAALPVVGTPSGGSRELFRDGENGLLFPAGDAPACAAALARLDSDPALRARLAATALPEVRARYDLAAITARIETYLADTIRLHARR
jgi:glycosyltransferase involved in cell wall biosynthesis